MIAIALSAACFGVMSLLAKVAVTPLLPAAPQAIQRWARHPVTPAETVLYRSVLGWLGMLAVARVLRASSSRDNSVLLALRGFFGGMAVLAFFFAYAHTDLSKASLIGYAYPVFSILFARVFFRERLSTSTVLLLGLGLAGVAMILWPRGAAAAGRFASFGIGDLSALAASIFSGAAIAILRRLRREEETVSVVLHFTFWCSVVSLPAVALSALAGAPPSIPDVPHVILLLLIAFVAVVGQLLLTHGYRHCDTAEGGTLSLLNAVFAVILGVLILGETMVWTTWVGGGMTLGACGFLLAQKKAGRRAEGSGAPNES